MALADIDESSDINHERDVIQDTAAMVFAGIYLSLHVIWITESSTGGSDTIMSAIHTFFLAMICFPEVQVKAQAELDRVVTGRLPDFHDVEELPYLSAVVKEVLRLATRS
jgi:Cytochrome P450